ncbi:proteinaceous RNase P 1, chloroplastic/mitochondrial isoform X3 [Vitis vinifera]|uniref:proteinaceous RNase P 1, chloroplastic/mitochondrial isoform X3 n=1 Tax=Vitis vinifera TaxID=29760 RepID=UPI00053FFEBB|nr:proteinaceous RNase P 1, chloroplastic/mitochondrial isoform X3 [Vitis vinifera]|eukprot:XP_010645027.1 PREDICTED: proteinaceous RNase P 1, chloroplastic/mitochondrial isoform X4 [Vitis vinifera]
MLTRARCLSFFFAKTPILCHVGHTRLRPLLHGCSHHHFKPTTYSPYIKDRIFMNKSAHFSNLALSATNKYIPESSAAAKTMSNKARKKARRESPEGVLRFKLDMCSKRGDVVEALRLYDEARSLGVPLSQHNYNVLLYLCSCSGSNGDENVVNLALKRGFEIFKQMGVDGIEPNEATFTSAARLACAMEDPEMAFNLVKQMKSCGIPPKLRSYGPPLFGFCKKGDANRAYEVDAHMVESGVVAEEPELCALLGLSVESRWVDQVYEMMHRLRASVRQVSESTAEVVERWFNSEDAAGVGEENWDVGKVREGVVKGGGGWHGQGWLGKGKWKVGRTEMDEAGVCQSCGEKLVGIDIDPRETENFASSLTKLACQREVKADFVQFQEWLQWHGPFDAVVDGANVSLINQKSFSFFELNSVVNCLRQISPSKQLPLVILHRSRVTGGPAQNPNNEKLIQSWKKSGALYATPAGSNDDWYWLYAAVNGNCLLVTNDEMRDHLFQLLGTSFFPRWKEKHQILPNTGMTSLDSVLTQGMNMKKKHEVEVLSAVVDSIANSVGADTIVDVGAGQMP